MSSSNKAVLNYGDGKSIEFPVMKGTVGPDVVDIRTLYGKTGMFTYDPGFLSTASCQSHITYIDGDKGELMYRGYPIEQLVERLMLPRRQLCSIDLEKALEHEIVLEQAAPAAPAETLELGLVHGTFLAERSLRLVDHHSFERPVQAAPAGHFAVTSAMYRQPSPYLIALRSRRALRL